MIMVRFRWCRRMMIVTRVSVSMMNDGIVPVLIIVMMRVGDRNLDFFSGFSRERRRSCRNEDRHEESYGKESHKSHHCRQIITASI